MRGASIVSALTLGWLLSAGVPALAGEPESPPAEGEVVISVESPEALRIANLFRAAETLRAVQGVESVEIRAGRSDLRAEFDPAVTSLPELVQALEEAGFRPHRETPLPFEETTR